MFIPPLAPDERKQLEQNIIQFGCKDPLIIWETTEIIAEISANEKQVFVLLDGHNRYEICQKYSIDFRVNIVEIPTFEKAQDLKFHFISFDNIYYDLATKRLEIKIYWKFLLMKN